MKEKPLNTGNPVFEGFFGIREVLHLLNNS